MELRFETPGRQSQRLGRFPSAQPLNIAEPHSLPICCGQALQALAKDLKLLLPRIYLFWIGPGIGDPVRPRLVVSIEFLLVD